MNPKVDWFFEKDTKWQQEYLLLRKIVLGCMLTEELKWGVPCYTFRKKNVLLMHGFKDYCALLFHKGALLSDTHHILVQQTKNVQAARQIRFTDIRQIEAMEAVVRAYIHEAIEVEKAGLPVEFKKTAAYDMPEEFQQKLDEHPELKSAFEALTAGRQRAYLLHFSQPKQAKTRASRIDKCMQQILDGKGMQDR